MDIAWNPKKLESKHLYIAFIAALLLHLALLLWNPIFQNDRHSRPVQIETIDPAKLEAMKQQNRSLLLDNGKPETAAPKTARYDSDKNRAVEKETRARSNDVIPRPAKEARQASQPEPQPRQHADASDLSKFGVKPRAAPAQQAAEQQTAQSAAQQSLYERDLPYGAENMLNTQESVYYSFYSRLYEAIGPLWRSRISGLGLTRRVPEGEYTTIVDVVLDSSGNLIDVVILNRSGIPEFDAIVPETWKKITRFPNPPKALISPDGYVHTGWNFTVHMSPQTGMQYSAPERAF